MVILKDSEIERLKEYYNSYRLSCNVSYEKWNKISSASGVIIPSGEGFKLWAFGSRIQYSFSSRKSDVWFKVKVNPKRTLSKEQLTKELI
ncbi:MAG: hypothetical protein ACOC1X_02840 [Promethearchaeota archaeon]